MVQIWRPGYNFCVFETLSKMADLKFFFALMKKRQSFCYLTVQWRNFEIAIFQNKKNEKMKRWKRICEPGSTASRHQGLLSMYLPGIPWDSIETRGHRCGEAGFNGNNIRRSVPVHFPKTAHRHPRFLPISWLSW
jgi:hypothetical protein